MKSVDDSCAQCALTDIVIEMPGGLAEVEDLPTAKALIHRIALKLSIEDVLERIALSMRPTSLLMYTPHVYGASASELRRVAVALLKQHRLFNSDDLRSFADRYWMTAFEAELAANGCRPSWGVIKMAVLGTDAFREPIDWLLPQIVRNEPVGLFVSQKCGRRMVQDLHADMTRRGLIPDVLAQPEEVPWGKGWPAGASVAKAIGGYKDRGKRAFTTFGLQALAVAHYCCSQDALREEAERRVPVI